MIPSSSSNTLLTLRRRRASKASRTGRYCGLYLGQAREEFFSVMDAANIDLKAFTDGFYRTLCSVELKPILENLEYVRARPASGWRSRRC